VIAADTQRRAGVGHDLVGVTLDALGTVVRLEDPVPRLQASLRDRLRLDVPPEACRAALRAEMRHYRAHCRTAVDAATLERLRRDCAAVLAAALGHGLSAAQALPCLMDAIAFSLYPDVPEALDRLDEAGLRLAVVSNWDVSLHATLHDLGIDGRFSAVLTSADSGSPKPQPELFQRAAAALDAPAQRLLHVGDDPAQDVDGARAAGFAAVLLQRDTEPDERTPRIRTLLELPGLIGSHHNKDGATR
jgi:putative hydrolase of the HAD superfamily